MCIYNIQSDQRHPHILHTRTFISIYIRTQPCAHTHSACSRLHPLANVACSTSINSRILTCRYFNVCGGPASVEIMSSMGPLLGFIGLIIMPIVWAIPLALVTCELSTAFPDNGGSDIFYIYIYIHIFIVVTCIIYIRSYGLWVSEAYGEFWGFMESYWRYVRTSICLSCMCVNVYYAIINIYIYINVYYTIINIYKCELYNN